MALNGKFVKIERVIEKARRDLPGNYDLSISNAIEMVGEAISAIGLYSAYVNKVTDGNKELHHLDPIVLENYRAKIPCDLYKLNSIRFITSYNEETRTVESSLPMISSSDVFSMNVGKPIYAENDLRYKVNNGYVYLTGIASGLLMFSYEAFATDERGFPLVPDDDRYTKAIVAYIQERIGFKLMMQDKLSERKYAYLEQNWLFYVNSAYTGGMLQTIDDVEAFRNSFVRMVSDSAAHYNSYSQESFRQEYRQQNKYSY